MAPEKLHCMNKARVESTRPPHSRRSHAAFRRQPWKKSRSHNPMRMRRDIVVVELIRRRRRQPTKSPAAASSRYLVPRHWRRRISGGAQKGELMIQRAAKIRRYRWRRAGRHFIEAHLWILISMVQRQEWERTVRIHRDSLDGPRAVWYINAMVDLIKVGVVDMVVRVLWVLFPSCSLVQPDSVVRGGGVGQGEVEEGVGVLGFGGEFGHGWLRERYVRWTDLEREIRSFEGHFSRSMEKVIHRRGQDIVQVLKEWKRKA